MGKDKSLEMTEEEQTVVGVDNTIKPTAGRVPKMEKSRPFT